MMRFLIAWALLSLSSCYQAHSDDDLRTVPATNNPNLIQDSARGAAAPGMAY
jgi:hypothetical protein